MPRIPLVVMLAALIVAAVFATRSHATRERLETFECAAYAPADANAFGGLLLSIGRAIDCDGERARLVATRAWQGFVTGTALAIAGVAATITWQRTRG